MMISKRFKTSLAMLNFSGKAKAVDCSRTELPAIITCMLACYFPHKRDVDGDK